MLNQEQINFYQENGYLIVDNVFSLQQLNAIKNNFENIISYIVKRAQKEYPNKQHLLKTASKISEKINLLEKIDHKYISEFNDCLLTSNNPYVASLVSSSNVLDCANLLLGNNKEESLFMTSSTGMLSIPYDVKHTANKWHTDVFYTCKNGHYIHLWAPIIEDSSKELGTLHLMPKKHKKPFSGEIRDNSDNDSDIYKFRISDDMLDIYEDKVIEIKQGQVLFFDKHLPHRGGINTTDRTRFGLITFFHSMKNKNFTAYPFHHHKSEMTSDEYFDEVMNNDKY